ncbi:MAG: glycerol-3-phosphate 1-O-acyltransferase PlsY [Acetobacteraceae bacterium]|nr:glycerol-3-phosphate 1-O-acyltransferase PlsY [Acetobacteraceae bacterium]
MIWWVVLLVILSYLLGSIPAGFLVVRAVKGVDVRRCGSGNVGAMNVYRTAGLLPAAVVGIVDFFKGAVPVAVAKAAGLGPLAQVLGAGAAIVGHNWSVFLRFGGGKGVAATVGAVAALDPWSALVFLLAWVTMAGITRYSSLGSMVGSCVVPLVMAGRGVGLEYIVFAAAAAAMVLYRHKSNIKRLIAGKELRIDHKAGPSVARTQGEGQGQGGDRS